MTTFRTTRRELTLEFDVKTAAKVTSFHGTSFVPNHCAAMVHGGQIISITLERMEDGWIADDPAVDGASLAADYGGGEINAEGRAKLPKIAQEALAAVEAEAAITPAVQGA